MNPRLQAGLELQLEKQAQQEHDSSLSGVLGQYFKQAWGPAVAAAVGGLGYAGRGALYGGIGGGVGATGAALAREQATGLGDATERFEQQGGTINPDSLHMPAPTPGDVRQQRVQRAIGQADIPSANWADILRDTGKRLWHGDEKMK